MPAPILHQMLATSLRYNMQRQKVLASNISNIDTPKYQAYDVKKPDFAKMAEASGQLQLLSTSGTHLTGTLGVGQNFRSDKNRKPFEITPVGNSVVLEEQMAKVSDTTASYEFSSTMLKKFTGLYKTALDNRGS
ncbi:MAG: flagellar basal body rod protein FlgB [Rickettsiales bacterium]